MTCTMCQKKIHRIRLEALPLTVTCCNKCSARRQLMHRAAGSKRRKRKIAAEKKENSLDTVAAE